MTNEKVEVLSPKKKEEWRKWGKEAFRGCASRMRRHELNPDYNTPEKREAIHLANEQGEGESAHYFKIEGRTRLRERWGYSEEAIEEAKAAWIVGYKSARKWHEREEKKQQAVLDKYMPIFKDAEEIAKRVDVSDIADGFPCGWAHLYLQRYAEAEDLYKALGYFNSGSSEQYKRQLPIKMPTYGQCIRFDERICRVVNEFLRSKGMFASVYSIID